MGKILLICSILILAAGAAGAGEPPNWMKQSYPASALEGAWAEQQAVFGPNGAIPPKMKYLIGLGVAAQIPCAYCIYFFTQKARAAGNTDAEIREAIAVAGLTRKWSTVLNGVAYDMKKFKGETGGPTN
jgi:AhpD family alkylhydroperoxidase